MEAFDSMGNSLSLPIRLDQESALAFVGKFTQTVPILLKFIFAKDILSSMSILGYKDYGEGLELEHKQACDHTYSISIEGETILEEFPSEDPSKEGDPA